MREGEALQARQDNAAREQPDAADLAGLVVRFRSDGHATMQGVFSAQRMDQAIADVSAWAQDFIAAMSPADRRWYLDSGVSKEQVLRKLDNPHINRPFFTALAKEPSLTDPVEALIGNGISVYFSQSFFKPTHGGGPKPAHQDNLYFGPNDPEGVVTAWVALDDADEENGCLRYGRATHLGPVLPHAAPPDRPFDLQIDDTALARLDMRPAPVPKGGVSFHHGGTVHRSADNRSNRWRRACAFHYVRNDVVFATPALPYDHSLALRVT